MGSECSQERSDSLAFDFYLVALQNPSLLPDVGIDESLLKYSGIDSNVVLQRYYNALVNNVPGYVNSLGSKLAPMTSIPNAVGLGALVISMIMEICIISATQTNDKSYSMFQRVFGEEKASAVRDTMSEYLTRHRTFMNNERRLWVEVRRLEAQLSNHLTVLRNSLLHDGQMSRRGFKIWVNGASFHLQMLIHEARLDSQTDRSTSVQSIKAAIGLYLQDLDDLLQKYKTHETSSTYVSIRDPRHFKDGYIPPKCYIGNDMLDEIKCERIYNHHFYSCGSSVLSKSYVNHVFSNYKPISGLKSHFSNIENNLNSLINQHDAFTLPSAT